MNLNSRADNLSSELFVKKSSFRLHGGSSTSRLQFWFVSVSSISVVNYFFSSRIARRSEGISAIGT